MIYYIYINYNIDSDLYQSRTDSGYVKGSSTTVIRKDLKKDVNKPNFIKKIKTSCTLIKTKFKNNKIFNI